MRAIFRHDSQLQHIIACSKSSRRRLKWHQLMTIDCVQCQRSLSTHNTTSPTILVAFLRVCCESLDWSNIVEQHTLRIYEVVLRYFFFYYYSQYGINGDSRQCVYNDYRCLVCFAIRAFVVCSLAGALTCWFVRWLVGWLVVCTVLLFVPKP